MRIPHLTTWEKWIVLELHMIQTTGWIGRMHTNREQKKSIIWHRNGKLCSSHDKPSQIIDSWGGIESEQPVSHFFSLENHLQHWENTGEEDQKGGYNVLNCWHGKSGRRHGKKKRNERWRRRGASREELSWDDAWKRREFVMQLQCVSECERTASIFLISLVSLLN